MLFTGIKIPSMQTIDEETAETNLNGLQNIMSAKGIEQFLS